MSHIKIGFGQRTASRRECSDPWCRPSASRSRLFSDTCISRMPRNSSLPASGRVRIVPYDPSHEDALTLIASVARGSIYVTAEQLQLIRTY